MLFVPWQNIADWKCVMCGQCCKSYSVVVNFQEWLRIIRNYGVEHTFSALNKIYLKRKSDGSCAFLCNFYDIHLCGLQHMKPQACRLWPFKIFSTAKYGYASEAAYSYGDNIFFVYSDSACKGLIYGKPTWGFYNNTLREFIETALGHRTKQHKTTANYQFASIT
jgi:Fe-S-cluster containining protein